MLSERYSLLSQRAQNLDKTVKQQTTQISGLQGRVGTLSNQLEDLQRERQLALNILKEISTKSDALAEEADQMRLLAGGASGLAGGILAGLGNSATGGTLVLYGVGGTAAGVGATVIYNKYVEGNK